MDRIEAGGSHTRLAEHSPQLPQGFTPVSNLTFWPGAAGKFCLSASQACSVRVPPSCHVISGSAFRSGAINLVGSTVTTMYTAPS